MTGIPSRVPHILLIHSFGARGSPRGLVHVCALPLGYVPARVHFLYLGSHTPSAGKSQKPVVHTERKEERTMERPRESGDRERAGSRTGGGWWPEEGAGRTFLASLSAPSRAIRPAGGRWSGETMARRSAEPGTKFGVAFAGLGAARSSPCKGETK